MTGRMCALLALVIPAYMIVVMGGLRKALEVLPAIVVCAVTFGTSLFLVSNFVGPELANILSALASVGALILVMKLWHPAAIFRLEGDAPPAQFPHKHSFGEIVHAWSPYILLVVMVLMWGLGPVRTLVNTVSVPIEVPGLHQMITRMPPVTATPQPYAAVFNLNWLAAAGTSCFIAAALASLVLGMPPKKFAAVFVATLRQLAFPMLTIASVLALAFLMNYSGMTSTLGLAFAATGAAFPFVSALLGWMGVFLTGSDTSSNALFGNLQVVTANALGLNPVLTASTNAAGGVLGKMISLQSIAVAVAATGMAASDEGKLFRATLRHSIILAVFMGVVALAFAYVFPHLAPPG
jgi:lactate permease